MQIKQMFLCLSLGLFTACGLKASHQSAGNLRLAVAFPQEFKTQVLPDQTHSVFVMVYGAANPLERPLLAPALSRDKNRMIMTQVPVGSQTVLAAAMDCQGQILSAAKTQVMIKPAPEITSVTLDLSTAPRTALSGSEFDAIDALQPDCREPVPLPSASSSRLVPTPTPRPSQRPETRPSNQPEPSPVSSPIVSFSPIPSPSGTPQIVRIVQENPFKMKINQENGGLSLEMTYTGDPVIASLIRKVDFLINGGKVSTVTSPPFNYLWETERRGEGQYTLQAVAYDNDGNEIARSNPATILLLIQYQTSSSGGNNGPNPSFCSPGLDLDGSIDLCQTGGASFSAEVTVNDGATGLDPIEVSSP